MAKTSRIERTGDAGEGSLLILPLGLLAIHVVAALAAVGDVDQRRHGRIAALRLSGLRAVTGLLREVIHLLGEVVPVGPDRRLGLATGHVGLERRERG